LRRKVVYGAAIALGFASLTGCGASDNPTSGTDGTPVTVNLHQRINIEGQTDINLWKVTMSDGTVCVVSDGNRSGGVSCDWSLTRP